MFAVIVLDLELVFTGEAKLFSASLFVCVLLLSFILLNSNLTVCFEALWIKWVHVFTELNRNKEDNT